MAMVSAMRLTWMPERRATVTAPKAVTSSLEKQRFPERACVGFGRLRPHRKQSAAPGAPIQTVRRIRLQVTPRSLSMKRCLRAWRLQRASK